MRLAPREPARSTISLVAMVDVLMIMLVFFMVTSTYLDLDMIPVAERGEAEEAASPLSSPEAGAARLVVRLGADGRVHLAGRPYTGGEIGPAFAAALAAAPGAEVIVLPSGGADVQALVSVMDAAVSAGAERVRIVRLEARP